jgi:hypothetical protein
MVEAQTQYFLLLATDTALRGHRAIQARNKPGSCHTCGPLDSTLFRR